MDQNSLVIMTDIICNRVEDMIKSLLQSYLENRTEAKDHSELVETLTVDELAGLLRISKPVAYELVNRADFPSFKIGKSIRIYRPALAEWMAGQAADQKG